MAISRRLFISSFILMPVLLTVSPPNSFGIENNDEIEVRLMTTEEYIKSVNDSGDGWVTWSLTTNNEVVVVDRLDTIDLQVNELALNPILISIAVWVGGRIVGKVLAHVVDGVIQKVTGADTTTWGIIAARQLLNRGVPAGRAVYLPCSIYPPHSGEYHRCMNA